MNQIVRLFVLVIFFNLCIPKIPAEVGTGKERLLGKRQCQTARRTFEVATAKGTPSLVETHPA